jgi:tRNA(adenine34) deaminase
VDYARFMKEALREARQALEAGQFPVGCVIVHRNAIVVTGARSHSSQEDRNELDHAEMTALRRLTRLDKDIGRNDVVVFSTLEPCLMCYGALIINGIRNIVYAYEDVLGGGTDVALKQMKPFYRGIQINLVSGVLRTESVDLLKRFFSDPRNDYLRGTLLARHALGE